jgi:hypothetical protein
MIDPADTRTKPLPQATRLRFESPTRIYNAMLLQDLFEQWMVIQSWGGKGNLRGGGKITHVDSFEAGMAMLASIAKRREKRGYTIAPGSIENE